MSRADLLAWHATRTMHAYALPADVLEPAALALTSRARDTADAIDLLGMCGLISFEDRRRLDAKMRPVAGTGRIARPRNLYRRAR